MQYAWTVLPSVACPVLQFYPHYLINYTKFGKKNVERRICVLVFLICFYCFQPVLYRLGIPRGIYRDVYSELFTEMFTVSCLQRCLQ